MIVYYFDDELFNPKFSLEVSDIDTKVHFELFSYNDVVKTDTVVLGEYDFEVLHKILALYTTISDDDIHEMLQLLFNNKLKNFQL